MTIVTSTESVLADARVTYARDQAQQAALTGAKVNSNPTESDLIANDPTLQAAILAAEDTSSASGGVGDGASGSSGGTPASGGGIVAAKPAPAPDTSAVSAAVNGVSVTA